MDVGDYLDIRECVLKGSLAPAENSTRHPSTRPSIPVGHILREPSCCRHLLASLDSGSSGIRHSLPRGGFMWAQSGWVLDMGGGEKLPETSR